MTRCVALVVALLALASPPHAFGDGAPVIGMDAGSAGVTVRGLPDRYVAMHSLRGTTIARIQRAGGRVVVSRFFPRGLVIPTVAYDGTATGLSADGSRLVAVRPLRRRTEFTVLETKRLKRRATISLRGRFTLDAVSRDGGLLYLIQTLSDGRTGSNGPSGSNGRYAVRAYHVGARELLPEPIVDPSEPDEPMTGMPLTRAMSRDGRWAYTLYDSPGHPFVHALDTEEATARCIDLHALAGRDDLLAIRLTAGRDGTIAVRHAQQSEPLLEIDPAGFTVTEPRLSKNAPAGPSGTAPAAKTSDRWPLIIAALAPLALLTFLVRHARRPRRPTEPR